MIQRVKIIENDGDTARLESVPCTCGHYGCEGVVNPEISRNILTTNRAEFLVNFAVGKSVEIDQDGAEDVNADAIADSEVQRRYEAFINSKK